VNYELEFNLIGPRNANGQLEPGHQHQASAMLYKAVQAVSAEDSQETHDAKGLKLWAVSPLAREKNRVFRMRVSSPLPKVTLGLLSVLTQTKVQVGGLSLRARACYPLDEPTLKERTLWVPWGNAGILTSHRDFTTSQRPKKTYCRPNDPRGQDVDALLKGNLLRKANALGIPAGNLKVKAVETAHRPVFTKIRGNWVIAWRGCVAVEADPEVQRMIWETGLGQQNAMGYGKVVPTVTA
jgi:CRISPR-associated endoribonuclease Cas6